MEDSKIIWYNSVDIFHPRGSSYKQYIDRPGFKTFKHMFSFFAANFSITDRISNVKFPINTKLIDECKLPDLVPVDYSFDELCERRARQLIDHAKNTNRKLVIMYSGGIDSTLILVSILKVATDIELKQNILVLLNGHSIAENHKFYHEHIIKKFKTESSYLFHAFLGNDKYVMVNGEGGDQLFGSAVSANIFKSKGAGFIFHEPTTEIISGVFMEQIKDEEASQKITSVLNRVVAASPVEIKTVYHYFWWINFALKWQSVYARSVAYTDAKFQATVKPEDNYFIFFGTPEMQLWTMNNTDKLIKDTWSSYKYVCKDIIYDFNGDADYRDNKLKLGSLISVVSTKPIAKAVGPGWQFYMNEYPENIWEDDNDFI
jgi:hypothetical protein